MTDNTHLSKSKAIQNLISIKHISVSNTYLCAGISKSRYYTFINSQADISVTRFIHLLQTLNVRFDELPLYISPTSASPTIKPSAEEIILSYKESNNLATLLQIPKRDFCNAVLNHNQAKQIRTIINRVFQHSEYYTTIELKAFLMFFNYFSDEELEYYTPRIIASIGFVVKRINRQSCSVNPDVMQVNTLLIYRLLLSSIRVKDYRTHDSLLTLFSKLTFDTGDWMSLLVRQLVEIVQLITANKLSQAKQRYESVLMAARALQPKENWHQFEFLVPKSFDLFYSQLK